MDINFEGIMKGGLGEVGVDEWRVDMRDIYKCMKL